MKHQRLLMSIVLGAVLGILFGSLFPEFAVRIKFVGDMFINALKMVVIPLIITSLIVGVTGLGDVRHLGSLGLKTITFYMVTTGLAVIVGLGLVNLVKPGEGFGEFSGELSSTITSKADFSFLDVFTGLIHPNLIQAASEFDILPLIIASLLFGVAFTVIGEKGKIIIDLVDALNDAIMTVVHWVILLTPVGVFGLISYRLGEAGGGSAFLDMVFQLGRFCFTVILGLLIHGLIVLPLILMIFARRNPLEYLGHLMQAMLTAFATSSSSATLPVTMSAVTDDAGVSKKTAGVVLPLGATINMDGTALYEAVSALFIAQCYGIDLTLGSQIVIFFTATLAAIGAAGIPSAGLVTMILVLQSVGLPIEGIGLILAIDWFLDRCRTTVNVWGDAVGAAVVDKLEGAPVTH